MKTPTLIVASFLAMTALAHAEPTPEGPTLPAEDARPGATRAQAVEAYVQNCHATLKTTAWEYEEEKQVSECLALDVDQNCNPDTFGCFSAFDSCQTACQPVCTRCQDTCASSCDDCKGACPAGDKACVRKCAESRADCRGRCMSGLSLCQGGECERGASECMSKALTRLKTCSVDVCNAYVKCIDAIEDYEKAEATCRPKAKGLDEFCFGVCRAEQSIPLGLLEILDGETAVVDDGKTLATRCTAAAECPKDYAELAPYLASFCGGTTSAASLEALAGEVKRGTISKRSLGLLFNAYGAIYGYEFKKEKWMNGFFYGAGGAWLPATCRAKVKTVASAKVMPFRMTKLRDQVKQIWNAAP